jgi:hypothetical protein
MPKTNRVLLVKISDPHCGYELGLTNPETRLTDYHGQSYQIPTLSESQNFVWDTYTTGLEQVQALAGRDPIHLFWMGDITHGNKFVEQQTSTRMSDQVMYAVAAMEPAYRLKNVKTSRMAFGTGVHVFGQGSSEIILSEMMRDKFEKINTRALYHGLADVGGVKIDYAHHGPNPGRMNWTRADGPRGYLKSKMMDDLDADCPPADLVVRGHFHSYIKTWYGLGRQGKWYESWLVVMPPLCLPGDYTRKATSSVYRVSPGIVAVEIINGRIHNIHPFTCTLDMRTVETL